MKISPVIPGTSLLLVVLWAVSCRHPVPPVVPCPNLPQQIMDSISGRDYPITGNPAIVYPMSLNPASADEMLGYLVIQQENPEDNRGYFIRYSLSQRQGIDTLPNISAWSPPEWGAGGWLVYDYQKVLFKSKSNGDSLTRLTFGPDAYYDPAWSADGKEIIAWKETPDHKTYTTVLSSSGEILRVQESTPETPRVYSLYGSCHPDGLVASTEYSGDGIRWLSILDISTLKRIKRFKPYPYPEEAMSFPISSVQWIPGTRKIAWCNMLGVYITDYDTETTETLWRGSECMEVFFRDVRPTADGKWLIVSVTYQSFDFDQMVYYWDTRVVRMSLSGDLREQLW